MRKEGEQAKRPAARTVPMDGSNPAITASVNAPGTIKKVKGGFTRKPRRRGAPGASAGGSGGSGGPNQLRPGGGGPVGGGGPADDGGGGGGGGGGGADDAPQKHRLCVDTLIEGYVQSYVDFFYLTHRADPNPDPNQPESSEAEIVVPLQDMMLIKKNLTDAESARRQGDTRTVYDSYDKLAKYYQEQGQDLKTAVYFYEKCLEIARLTSDAVGEMNANHHLGLSHAALGDVPTATGFHERHLDLAKASAAEDQAKRACMELTKMYEAQARAVGAEIAAKAAQAKAKAKAAKAAASRADAGKANAAALEAAAAGGAGAGQTVGSLPATSPTPVEGEEGAEAKDGAAGTAAGEASLPASPASPGGTYGMPEEDEETAQLRAAALSLHERCLTAARGTAHPQTIGLANYRLGCALVESNDPKRGIDYLTEYLSMCTELKDVPGQGAASSALARAHLRLDSVPLAVEHLERFLQIAKKTDDLAAQVRYVTDSDGDDPDEANSPTSVAARPCAFVFAAAISPRMLSYLTD